MTRCHIFEYPDAQKAGEEMSYTVIKRYGNECNGLYLHTWDDGERYLAKCQKCGCLILVQLSEYHGMEDDDYYDDFFPVESEAAADEINQKWDGFQLESDFRDKYLMRTNGKYHFVNSEK